MENYQAVFKRKEIKYLLSSEERNALLPILEAHMEPSPSCPGSRLLPLIRVTERRGRSSTSWTGCWLLMKTWPQGYS